MALLQNPEPGAGAAVLTLPQGKAAGMDPTSRQGQE